MMYMMWGLSAALTHPALMMQLMPQRYVRAVMKNCEIRLVAIFLSISDRPVRSRFPDNLNHTL